MKVKNCILFILLIPVILFCQTGKQNSAVWHDNVNKYVDPYIGTGGHGHTFMGVAAPFGAVQIGPNNINKGWDWCSGYHYSDSVLIGFSHLHLNGTGCSDTGDLLFMPYTGSTKTNQGTQENPTSGYGSHYSHEDEVVGVGYYSVLLKDHNVKVELTASDRVAFHKYTFLKNDKEKHVMINLKDANGDDQVLGAYMEQVDDVTIRGYRFSSGWTKNQQIYFVAKFSSPVSLALYDGDKKVSGNKLKGLNVKGNVSFPKTVSQLKVKVGISPVSMENAQVNIDKEIPAWNFEKIVKQTEEKWNKELNTVQIQSNDSVAKRIFYSGMYHAFIQPIIFNDFNKDYRGSDKKVYKNVNFNNYTVFSLWDTYRAAHPLYTIVQPQRVADFVNSMIAINDQQGMLPVWHLYGGDTYEMIGIQSVPVVADAILKNFSGFDYEKAYQAMKTSMLSDYKGLNYLKTNGFIPSDLEKESVAKGLEYSIADWSIAQVAKKLGKDDDYKLFSKRAKNYQYYWDDETHFFRGKNQNGTWREPFSPFSSTHRNDDYCEGNGYQYTWLVPHDVEGLISLFKSEQSFVNKLDSLFQIKESLGEEASPDISGMIGQYAHGNEPGHHTIYLYAFAGQQWKTAQRVREVLDNLYHDQPDGLAGNEDCGQMSSWYIFSTLGFYPVNPANGLFVFGSPYLFDKATIALPQNKKFEIIAQNNSKDNMYIQSVELNGKPYTKSYIMYDDIMKGGTLKFIMGNRPNYEFGKNQQDRPKSIVD